MLKDKFRILDIEFDSEKHGDIIDPYEWNMNFKKTEEVFNENLETLRNVTAGDLPVTFDGAESDVQSAVDYVVNRLNESDQTDQDKFNEVNTRIDEVVHYSEMNRSYINKINLDMEDMDYMVRKNLERSQSNEEKNTAQDAAIEELQTKVELLEDAQGDGDFDLSGLVRYDREQTLTGSQKTQVCTNIGAASSGHVHEGMVTTNQMNIAINEATKGLASTTDVNNAVSGLASTSYVDEAISSAIGDSVAALSEMDGVIG